ncbi:hypothetical protein DMJ13_03530 [halophilic archaeon]|nr:hypothetical protein DMJ13_03530 [halophilic archaeon]
MRSRGQSNVVGVALLLGVTVVALGTLTASIGMVVDGNAAAADANRVAADFDDALAPVAATGVHRGRVSFTEGRLETVERDLRVLDEGGVVHHVRVDALVFSTDDRRVAFLAGAVVRGTSDGGVMVARPPVTSSREMLVVGAPKLGTSNVSVAATTGSSAVLRTNVTHERVKLGDGTYRVAVETSTPDAWRRHFERRNATVSTWDFDDDGVESVVAAYSGERVAYLVVHDMRLEVTRG